MLTDGEVLHLLNTLKYFVDTSTIDFPVSGDWMSRELKSEDGHESFLVDINRKGKINLTKCTFQNRYQVTDVLLRLDIDGRPHENPDGAQVPCPHLHIYREGFADKFAFALDSARFTEPSDLVRTFQDFLKYINAMNAPKIQKSL